MPETPQPDTPDMVGRRHHARRLTQLLGDECRAVRRAIDAVRPLLPAVALSIGLLSGCASVGALGTWWEKPTVTFATPAAWRCDEAIQSPGRYGTEACRRCMNIARSPQELTINGEAQTVAPKGTVVICATQAVVE